MQFLSKTFLSFRFLLNKNRNSRQNPRKFKWQIINLIKKHIWIRSFHCVGLSRSSLSISKNASIFTIQSRLNEWFNFFKYLFLLRIWQKNLVKIINMSAFLFRQIQFHALMLYFLISYLLRKINKLLIFNIFIFIIRF